MEAAHYIGESTKLGYIGRGGGGGALTSLWETLLHCGRGTKFQRNPKIIKQNDQITHKVSSFNLVSDLDFDTFYLQKMSVFECFM